MAKYKLEKTPYEVCWDKRACYLIPLLKEAYSIEYEEEPQYGKIIFMMEKMLLDKYCIPDKYFTWFQKDFVGRPLSDQLFNYLESQNINLESVDEFENS
jgi:hypothetical protein